MDIRKLNYTKRFSVTNVLFVLVLIIACSGLLVRSAPPSQLEKILAAGELRVLSKNGPTSFYEGSEGLTGYEYTLLEGFATSLGVKLVINEEDEKTNQTYPAIKSEAFDVISAAVAPSLSTTERLRFASPYMHVTQQVIFNASRSTPKSPDDLVGKTVLMLGKSAQLDQNRQLEQSLPGIEWAEVPDVEMIDLLDMVEQGKADYAVVDSAIYELYRYSYPHTRLAFAVTAPQPVAWAFADIQDRSLQNAVEHYLANIRKDGTLAQVTSRFFDQMLELTTHDTIVYAQELERRLPKWEKHIKAAADEHGIDWQLVAAVGYQESHWDPKAESVTGVRGFMMLTNNTAKELGVKNREDALQSINGGAKYLKYLEGRLSSKIQGEDRLAMALAAYNAGFGHLQDARTLTAKKGGNPNSWKDVSLYFPLLAKRQYYSTAKHGYTRGWEPVTYVQNVVNYHKILQRHEKHEQFRMATLNNNTVNTPGASNPMYIRSSAVEKLSRNNLDNSTSLSIL